MIRILMALLAAAVAANLQSVPMGPVFAHGAAPSLVQQAQNSVISGTSVTTSFGARPATGDVILLGVTWVNGSQTSLTLPPGTWTQVDVKTGGGSFTATYWHAMASGDTSAFAVANSTSGNLLVTLFDIAGANASTPINQHAMVTATGTNPVSPSVTPSQIGTLAIALGGYVNATAASSGWTYQVNNTRQSSAVRTALTSDTTTAINCTFSAASSTNGVVATVLIRH